MFHIEDEGHLPSLSEIVDAKPGQVPDDACYDAAARAIAASDVDLPSTMSIGTDLRSLIDRLFLREFVEELPEQDCSLPWLECHVPPQGSMAVLWGTSEKSESSLGLKVSGLGAGAGRRISISIDNKVERTTCATYCLDLRVIPRRYRLRGRDSVELEVVRVKGDSSVSEPSCQHCGVVPDSISQGTFEVGDHLDLRNDIARNKRRFKLAIERTRSFEGGMKLPQFPVSLKVAARVSRGIKVEYEAEFPPGFLYQAYARRAGPLQTPMWALGR